MDPFSMAMLIGGTASMLGSLFIIVIYKSISNPREKIFLRLVYYIAISDFLAALGACVGLQYEDTPLCYFQAILTNIFELSSFFWTSLLSVMLFSITVLKRPIHTNSLLMHFLSWGMPVVLTFLPLTTNKFGPVVKGEAGWCFVSYRDDSPEYGQLLWIFLSFYLWVWLAIAVMFGLYGWTLVYSFGNSSIPSQNISVKLLISKVFNKLKLYPLLIVLAWSLPTFTDVSSSLVPPYTYPNSDLISIFSLGIPTLQGFFTAIVFIVYNNDVIVEGYENIRQYVANLQIKPTNESYEDEDKNVNLQHRERHDAEVDNENIGVTQFRGILSSEDQPYEDKIVTKDSLSIVPSIVLIVPNNDNNNNHQPW